MVDILSFPFPPLLSADPVLSPSLSARTALSPSSLVGLESPRFHRVRWSPDGSGALYTLVNTKAGCCYVAQWQVVVVGRAGSQEEQEQEEEGEECLKLELVRWIQASGCPGTSGELSRDGRYFGVGTSEGAVALLSLAPSSLALRGTVDKAHMVFGTCLAFSASSAAQRSVTSSSRVATQPVLLSASADASAYVLDARRLKSALARKVQIVLLLLMAIGFTVLWTVRIQRELGRRAKYAARVSAWESYKAQMADM